MSYQPFQYAGEYTNPTPADTQHLHTREYRTDTMRFTTKDSEALHNLYAYGNLNPITNTDPTGRTAFDDFLNWTVFGASLLWEIIGVVTTAVTIATGGATTPLVLGLIAAATAGVAGLAHMTTGVLADHKVITV